MAKQVRSVDFLPEIFQTPVNKQFLSATLDQLIQNPQYTQTQGFIGRRVGPGVNANDSYVIEPTKTRTDYQLEPGVVQIDPADSHKVVDAITYPGINDALQLQGGLTDNANRLYTSDYYTWDPFVDLDKFVNYAQYYWLPSGPLAVDVSATEVPLTDNFVVTRSNGAYQFSGIKGDNPTITLVRSSVGAPTSYTFQVAQAQAETVNFRVTNNDTSSWNIDYSPNPTLTLVRGNTYVFNLTQSFPWAFYIKTSPSLGTTNIYSDGVFNNGAGAGLITFTVPQDAPDVLYYCNDLEFNLRGQINVTDANPGTGPGFWIQTSPGVNGRIPATPNISSRLTEVNGVINNGIDQGTITFNVPSADAQNFYYNMPSVGTVDLVTTLQFDQINNKFVDEFFTENPNGIDGITNLENRTIAFITQNSNPETGGWQETTFFDPLANLGNVVSGSGSYDSLLYDQTTFITDPVVQYGIWRIQYITAETGGVYLSLQPVQAVDLDNKFTVGFGDQYSSTSWYKNGLGYFEQIPLLTADKNVLYYQDGTDPEIFGRFNIIDLDMSTSIDVDAIIGRANYTSPNGVVFTNGLKVVFRGNVFPSSYQNNEYYVEGVGTAIKLLPVGNFVTPETYTNNLSIPYDTTPYDFGNFDGSLNQPDVPDYITINRASLDLNAWTRSNRWFHIDVITASAKYNNTTPVLDNAYRARRPILEFRAGTRLFDFGTQGLAPVNIIDTTQTDALSNVNGSIGYSTDGYSLINGSTIIFAADTDPEVRNKIYRVEFVVPDTVAPLIPEPLIVLTPVATALPDQTVVILDGNTQQGLSYYYDGVSWIQAQQKISVNQPPLFDIYNSNGISFGNRVIYPSSNFKGSPLFSYAVGNAAPDLILGFPLTYLSLTNIGDIVFDNNFYKDSFSYTLNSVGQTVPLSTGFVRQYSDRVSFEREIGWQTAVTTSLVRQQFQFTYDGAPLLLDVAVNQNTIVPAVQIYINGTFQEAYNYTYTVSTNTTTINLLTTYVPGDLIEVTVLSDQVSTTGFYEVPINLSNNPLNGNSDQFTLGTIRNHYIGLAENLIALQGPPIGANNTRDLGNIIPYGLQILQQSSPLTLTGYFMRDPNYNIFASLSYNSAEYIKFKSQLLNAVTTFGIADYDNWTVAQLLDASIAQVTAGRTNLNSFYWSDMLPAGTVFTSNSYTVNPITTNRFNTIQTYDFTTSNYLGLCVYVNNVILTREYDYVVSTEGPTLTITVPLNVGDVVTINEYSNTTGNFVPNTPTKLGLYPKYEPKIFLDNDYVNPTPVIQGHDGSITVAFGDIRDQVLLEFEKRIFSNLKNDGNPPPLVAEDVIPGYFRKTDYTQSEINQILGEDFLAWVGANKLDYTTQTYIANNEFTYNYSQAGNRLDNEPLLGAWRGIYRYFYDTLTPNLTPWEMLGLSEMPTWWEDSYGPAPYTSDNLVLWDDLQAGLVKDPVAPYVNLKYRRPGLTDVIPVDSQGQLLPPFYGVMGAYNPNGFVKSWQVGDGSPVEASWWMSSSYPFAVMRLLLLTRPAEFFSLFADRDLYRYSAEFDQYLYNGRYRIQPQNIQVYGNGVSKASYINWIVDYNQQLGMNSTDELTTDLANLDVRLCYRAASFVAQQNLAMYLEKGSPESQNSSLLIPPESYNLLLYKNQPFNRINYSAVIIEVVDDGYAVYGYSSTEPYFTILESQVTGLTQTLTGGNISVNVPKQYTNRTKKIPYGYVFTNLASVVDFLLSYGQYLTDQGLVFIKRENNYTLNWIQMSQEFLYFAEQGWSTGTIINLNPSASQIISFKAGAVVDSIVTYTPENLLLDQNRRAFDSKNLIIQRLGNTFTLNPAPGGSQTISYLQLKFTDYEDMVVLDNRTIFNDLIYNTVTAERQNRLKLNAATSTQWNGTLNAQGFILNQNNVVAWKANTKYTKGDIVIYKNSYWQAATIIQPKTTFEYADWYKSNYDKIQQGLLQNLATKADQLANSYDTQTANLNRDNDLLAYNLIGFNPRQYMVDLNLSDASQVQLYQQFIKTKGTTQATDLFTQVNFDKLTAQYNIYENWGILVGTYGAQANRSWFEIALNEAKLTGNPSTVQIIQPGETSQADQTILLSNLWAESYAIPNTNILPTTYTTNSDTALPSAGYVNINDVDITVFNLNDPTNIAANLSTIGNGTRIWVAQDNSYNWNIYQCAQVPGRLTQISDNLNGTSRIQFSSTVNLAVGDLIIIRYFDTAVDGVYRVLSRPSIDSAVIEYTFTNSNQTTIGGTGIVFYLQTMRVSQASDVINLPYANQLVPGATAWVDNDGSGHWEVIQKTNPFVAIDTLTADDVRSNSLFGSSLSQSTDHYALLVGSPNDYNGLGSVYTFRLGNVNDYVNNVELYLTATDASGYGCSVDFGNRTWAIAGANTSNSGAGYATVLYMIPGSNDYLQTQLLVAPDQNFDPIGFGTSVQITDNERWIYVGAPGANTIYAYNRVDAPLQSVEYIANGHVATFTYNENIMIDSAYPEQLLVILDNQLQIYGTDYIINNVLVQFLTAPSAGSKVIIRRRTSVQLDSATYYNVAQNSTTGSGTGAAFTVNNTRGVYSVTLTSPGVNYTVGDQLTINYTQVDPMGSVSNNLTITVDSVTSGGITGFTPTGSGVSNTATFSLINYLYTVYSANTYDSFTVTVDGVLQRPYIDYTFSAGVLTFITVPAAGTIITVDSASTGSYWQYVNLITSGDASADAQLGYSLTVDKTGTQILAGAPYDTVTDSSGNIIDNAGAVYAFDRSVFEYIISDATQLTYAIPGTFTDPVSVTLNNQYLTNTDQYINGQFTLDGSNIILSSSITLTVGDILQIETNQFQFVQKISTNDSVVDESQFGYSLDICSNSCSVYVGAPHDSFATGIPQAGMVQREVNQSRIYGVTTSNVANPTLTPGDTIRINNIEVAVPNSPNNTVAGLITAINSAGIPNVTATTTNVTHVGDGSTKIFKVGNIYSSASAYTTVVYVDSVLQTAGVNYTYDNTTQTIAFVSAPVLGAKIQVVSGRITLSVKNAAAAATFNKLTVLPGTSGTAFADLGFTTYAYTQTITSPAPSNFAYFGASLSVNTGAVNLVVGSPGGNVYEPTTFDGGKTYFDEHSTTFFNSIINSGVAFTYDYLPSANDSLANPGKFVFGQQVYVNNLASEDHFGTAVNYRNGRLLVGAPGSDLQVSDSNFGSVSVLDNPADASVWQVIYVQQPMVDVNLINSVYSYDKLLNSTQTYFDYIDPLQGKILGVARRNIDYIGAVDPASYSNGTVHNTGTSWGPAHEGEIWWDTNSVRFIDANQDNLSYASKRWGQVFPGSTIDIYQWVASSVPPASYTGTGTPLSITSYTVYSSINDQGILTTTYYFWVRGIDTVATEYGKTLSATAIANYILNPSNSGLPYIAALTPNAIAIYNASTLLSASDTILHVEYDRQALGSAGDIHTEYEFIADGKADAFLNPNLYRKLLDSFCGTTVTGAAVPDPLLSPGMQYGVQFRPRQSMFGNRYKALENYLGYANTVLAQYPISETRSFNLLNSAEPTPAPNSGAWNFEVPTLEVLSYQDLYVVPVGYKYLVLSDTSQDGRWTIYEVANGTLPGQLILNLVRIQNYDTPLYWSYINWYRPGYNSSIQPVATVANTAGLQTLTPTQAPVGSSVKVTANGQGKFEIYLRTSTGWDRVGLQDGTIKFDSVLWDYTAGGYGFDAEVFDANYFDQEPTIETRYILRAINEELFIDDLLIDRNRALILMFKFIYSEFTSPTWLFKSSYIDVDHVIRGLLPYQLYQPDNQTFVLDYLNEVKPYHVQNLAFNLIYDGLDTFAGNLTDYDVPAYWNTALELPQFVSPILTPYTYSDSEAQSFVSDAASSAQIWLERPWSDWFNNYGLSLDSMEVSDTTTSYTDIPIVTVGAEWEANTTYTNGTQVAYRGNLYTVFAGGTTGTVAPTFTSGSQPDGTATLIYSGPRAQVQAVLRSNGTIATVNVTSAGYGYLYTPLVGINGVYPTFDPADPATSAKLIPIMGNNLVRNIKTTIKYDRYQYASNIYEWQANVVYNEGEQVRWNNRVWSSNTTQSSATFIIENWTLVNSSTLSGVDRTMGFYTPTANMPGLQLPLLIDGIDYPGVQVDAPDFNQNTGFDVGNYDINPYDNYSLDANGQPTYDPAILDARYASAYLDPYLGTRATDINVDGGAYIGPFSSHAPEELVPGSEFDTLDLRVYTTPGSDWLGLGHGFPIGTRKYVYDPENPVLSFKGILQAPMVVILFNVTLGLVAEPLSYDWANYELTVDPATTAPGNILEIYVTGTGGGNQLMTGTYLGSEMTNGNEIIVPFPTSTASIPPVDSIYEFVIYNGEIPLVNGVDYTWEAFGELQTKILFTDTYGATDRINFTALGYGYNGTTYSWSLPVFETIVVENSGQLTYTLTNSLQGTNPVNVIVTRNGARARPYEGVRYIGDGSTVTYDLPTRGGYSQGIIADNDVEVYVNNTAQVLGIDFVVDPWDGSSDRTITFLTSAPPVGSVLLISVRTAAQYWVVGDQIQFRPSAGLNPQQGDIIEITTWNDTSEQGILTQVFVGPTTSGVLISEGYSSTDYDAATVTDTPGSYDYSVGTQVTSNTFDTGRIITDPERILVTINGKWVFNNDGYVVDGSNIIVLGPALPPQTVVAITSFTQSVVPGPLSFRIFQDMRGVQATYRMTPSTTTYLETAVSATADSIQVGNIEALTQPNFDANIWGVLTIDAERIMYRHWDKATKTVSGLLRGTAGTAITAHASGAIVYNLGRDNLLPQQYQDYIVSNTTLGDGSTTVFTAPDITTEFEDSTIIDETVEVYVGGIRVYQSDGSSVINGYVFIDNNPVTIEFDTAPPAGVDVTILVRRGQTWYQQGAGTASNGVPLQLTETIAARFLRGQ
jgi:hypothetical protein